MNADTIFEYLGQLAVYGGGIVAISFGMFKLLGTRWLDAHFDERLQNLKADQDRQLRYVQSVIDRDIHRARKLYDREFDALSEVWKLFCAAHQNAKEVGMESYPALDRHSKDEFNKFVGRSEMAEHEKADLLLLEGAKRTEFYRRWLVLRRYTEYRKQRWAFKVFLDAHSVFFSKEIQDKLVALDSLVGTAIEEMKMRVDSQFRGFDAAGAVFTKGEGMRKELEDLIRQRIWSSDVEKQKSDVHA